MLKWREADEKERIWVVDPSHQICDRLPEFIETPDRRDVTGKPFDITSPDTIAFISWFEDGDVFRSDCCYQRGQGMVCYFRPGHEHCYPMAFTCRVVRKVIARRSQLGKAGLQSADGAREYPGIQAL